MNIFFREITHHFYLGNCVAIPKPIRPVPINKPISLIFSFWVIDSIPAKIHKTIKEKKVIKIWVLFDLFLKMNWSYFYKHVFVPMAAPIQVKRLVKINFLGDTYLKLGKNKIAFIIRYFTTKSPNMLRIFD